MAFVEAHLGEQLTTRLVARQAGLSVPQFCWVFKKATGGSFKQWTCRARVEKAKGLLVDASRPVKEVALECGFQSPRHFFRIFRRYAGCTALEYRQRLRHQNQNLGHLV
jgi:transcriptional regulator GlxA family with amidase domain